MTVRYQRLMPPIVNHLSVPWFPDDEYLITELASRLASLATTSDALNLHGWLTRGFAKYPQKDEDRQNRSQSIQLDARSFAGAMGGGLPPRQIHQSSRVVMWRPRCAMLPRSIFRLAD